MPDGAREKTKKYCAILGVPENAGIKELKKAYHLKAAALHPDARPGDPFAAETFKKVNAAYQYLKKNARKRKTTTPPPVRDVARAPHSPPPPEPALAAHSQPSLPPDELAFRLKYSSNTYLRVHAVRTLQKTGGREAVWAILPAIEDPNRQVAAEAVAALGRLGARIATLPLIQLYKKADTILQLRIVWALKRIDSPIAARFVSSISGENNDESSGDFSRPDMKMA